MDRRGFLVGSGAVAAAAALPRPALPHPWVWTGPASVSIAPGRHLLAGPLTIPRLDDPRVAIHGVAVRHVGNAPGGRCEVWRRADDPGPRRI